MRVLGLISGTSHDGIDHCLVDLEAEGEVLHARLLATGSTPYPPALRGRLRDALPPAPTTLAELARLDTEIGHAFADAAAAAVGRDGVDRPDGVDADSPGGADLDLPGGADLDLPGGADLDLPGGADVDLIVSHGQTVYHWVEQGRALGTCQIGQAAFVAERLGVPVLADVRVADLAAGGHGAPLVPLLDALLLGAAQAAVALNLGGIANLTRLSPGAEPRAHDIGPANALVDAVVAAHGLDAHGYDTDGRLAAAGRVHEPLLAHLLTDPYYAAPPPKSTGKEHFHPGYVDAAVAAAAPGIDPVDLVATLTELTARTVAADLAAEPVTRVVAAGGGVHNRHLMGRLRALLPGVEITTTDELGVPSDAKEALAFAVIGWFSWHRLPGSVASATGARASRILGALHQGPHGVELPPRPTVAPRRLVVEQSHVPGRAGRR